MSVKIFTARQPIFNRKKKVIAYELLFRDSEKNCFPVSVPGDVATSKLLVNTLLNMDIDDVTDSKPALINFSENILKSKFYDLVPSKKVIIEILEDVEPSDDTYEWVKILFHKGYTIALDDFVYSPEWERFYQFVKLIKIDIIETPIDKIKDLIKDLKKRKIKILAEKVETYEEYELCKKAGFDYFQGYFFCKPEMIHATGADVSQHLLMQIYTESIKEDADLKIIKKLFSQEPKLSYKLLRYLNKMTGKDITSIGQGIAYLGIDNIRKLTSLLITAEISPGKPHELVKTSVVRSRFCELIAHNTKYSSVKDEAFMTGLFSTMDALLDREMGDILHGLPLSQDIKSALLEPECNNLGLILSLSISYQKGEWDMVKLQCRALGINSDKVTECYKKAMKWESHMNSDDQGLAKKSSAKKVA
jgi:EAL and modified HD-GYP domain-containing signal transduction protein